MDDATLAALRTTAGAVFDVAFAAMVGALATRALLNDAASEWALRTLRRSRRLFMRASGVALLASVAWLAVEALTMVDGPAVDALRALPGIVTDTPFGRAWAVATLAQVASLALVLRHERRAPSLRALALAAAVVAVAHADAGHAGANGFGALVVVMGVHQWATALWSGSVFATALCPPAGVAPAGDGVRHAARLSRLASVSLAVVVLTGVASAWHGLGGAWAPLRTSTWGLILDAKVGLVGVATALGAFNRFGVLPALPTAWPRFMRVLRVESVVLLAVLVTAALLANGEPPAV